MSRLFERQAIAVDALAWRCAAGNDTITCADFRAEDEVLLNERRRKHGGIQFSPVPVYIAETARKQGLHEAQAILRGILKELIGESVLHAFQLCHGQDGHFQEMLGVIAP